MLPMYNSHFTPLTFNTAPVPVQLHHLFQAIVLQVEQILGQMPRHKGSTVPRVPKVSMVLVESQLVDPCSAKVVLPALELVQGHELMAAQVCVSVCARTRMCVCRYRR